MINSGKNYSGPLAQLLLNTAGYTIQQKGKIMRLIISQRYIQTTDGTKVSLIDLFGNDALLATDKGTLEKIDLTTFKHLYKMASSV